MGRITGEQNSAVAVCVGKPPVYRKLRKPHRIADAHAALGPFGQDLAETVENRVFAELFVASRVIRDYPPQIIAPVRIGHRHYADQPFRVNPTRCPSTVYIPIKVDVRQQETFA